LRKRFFRGRHDSTLALHTTGVASSGGLDAPRSLVGTPPRQVANVT
jgi:hypothetical protein